MDKSSLKSALGAAASAATLYLFGPARGTRHRAQLRNTLQHASHETRGAARDLARRASAGVGSHSVGTLAKNSLARLSRLEHWPLPLRIAATAGGSSLVLWGIGRRGALGLAGAALGSLLLARAATNVPLRRLAARRGAGNDTRLAQPVTRLE